MAQSSFPFNNQDTSEVQFTHWAREFQDNGVVESASSNALAVSADSTGMYVDVQPGRAFVQGFFYESTSTVRLTLDQGAADRYDWIVLRLNMQTDSIVLAVAKDKGTDETLLTQDPEGIFELPLARVTVTGNAFVVPGANVTDRRHWVSSRMGIWTTNTRPRTPRLHQMGRNTTLSIFEFWNGTAWTKLLPDAVAVSWTTGTRPASPALYQLGRNTTLNIFEYWDGTTWTELKTGGGGAPIEQSYTLTLSATSRANTWQQYLAPIPTTNTMYGVCVAVGGKLYSIGGAQSGTGLNYVYNPALDSWATKTVMPASRQQMAGDAIGTTIYLAGGFSSTGTAPVSNVDAYDTVADTWTTKSSTGFTARYMGSAGAINGKLYVAGGNTTSGANATNVLEVFDPVANTWTTKAAMPVAKYGAATAVANGKLYVICGGAGSTPFNTVYEYDPVANTWAIKAPAPTTRYYASAATINGKIYVIGGYTTTASSTATASVDVYNPATDTWTTGPVAPSVRYQQQTVVIGNYIYSTSGIKAAANSTTTDILIGDEWSASPFLTLTGAATVGSGTAGVTLRNTTTGAEGVAVSGRTGHQITATGDGVRVNGTTALTVVYSGPTGTVAPGQVAISTSEKGIPNGVATLDASGLVPAAQMPASFNPTLTAYNTADLSPVSATPVTVADLTGLTAGTWQVTIEGQASAANTTTTGLTLTGLNGLTVAATASGTSGSSRLVSSYFNGSTWSAVSNNLSAGTNNAFGFATASVSASFAAFRVSGLVRVTAGGDLRVTGTGTTATAGNHTVMLGTLVRAVKVAA